MKTQPPLSIALACLGLTLLTVPDHVEASPFEKYPAAASAYFSGYSALPILMADNEKPGDIYIDPSHGFEARSDECFSGMLPSTNSTTLIDSFESSRSGYRGTMRATVAEVARISAEVGASLQDTTQFSFSDATISGFSANDLRQSLRDGSTGCADVIREILERGAGYQYQERIPWILRQVVYAKASVELLFSQMVGAQAQADLAARLGPYIRDPRASMTVDLVTGGSLRLVSQEAVPVAYRPAFVSLDDLTRLRYLDNHPVWQSVWEYLGRAEPAQEQLADIREKFPEIIVPPEEMFEEMQSGEQVLFEETDEEHLVYLSRRGLLLSISFEIFGD